MVWPCCSYSTFEIMQEETEFSQQNQQHQEVGKEKPHNQSMGGHNWVEESLKGSPYFGLSMLRSASWAAKLKKAFSRGFLSFSTSPAWLRSTTDSKGFVSSWGARRWWCAFHTAKVNGSYSKIHAFPFPNPALSAHKPYWPGQWGSCMLSMSAEITKTLWLFIILPYFLDFSNYFAISRSQICCTGELLSESRSGDFPLSITISRPTSSLIH